MFLLVLEWGVHSVPSLCQVCSCLLQVEPLNANSVMRVYLTSSPFVVAGRLEVPSDDSLLPVSACGRLRFLPSSESLCPREVKHRTFEGKILAPC